MHVLISGATEQSVSNRTEDYMRDFFASDSDVAERLRLLSDLERIHYRHNTNRACKEKHYDQDDEFVGGHANMITTTPSRKIRE